MKRLIKSIIYALAAGMLTLPALQANAQITDGPYVFYRNGFTIVKRVISEGGGQYTAQADSFKTTDRSKQTIAVHAEGHPDWDFSVKLKDKIMNEQEIFPASDKTLILSDIEGEFSAFRDLLLAAKAIDQRYNWTFGKGSLIIAGDLFDRGKQVSQYLWLLYKLEDEAKAKGGAVHVILGNHDIMNLGDDFRYVQREYTVNAGLMGLNYKEFYGPDTELGRWLRSKNIIEKHGDLLVMHGGISPEVNRLQLSIQQINSKARPFYDNWMKGINDPIAKVLFSGNASPFWYRGYFMSPMESVAQVDSTMAFYGCRKIIVGHDVIDHVVALYGGKVIGVDVNEHEGTHEALLIDNNRFYRIDEQGRSTALTEQ